MQKSAFWLALAALAVSLMALLRPLFPVVAEARAPRDVWREERRYPPLVFSSKAWLDCSISSSRNGRQLMQTLSGQGFSFDATMLPIRDGQVKLLKPGMHYEFTSFPQAAVPAKFAGLGDGVIREMKAEVAVDVLRFKQPDGAGTTIHFTASDMRADAAYVEFTGLFVRQKDKKRFPFRVVFGSAPAGGGSVTPGSAAPATNIMSKSVRIGSPKVGATVTTALYEAEDSVRQLP